MTASRRRCSTPSWATTRQRDGHRRGARAAPRVSSGPRSASSSAPGITPSMEFFLDSVPETAKEIEDLLAKVKASDDEVARARRRARSTPATPTRTRSPGRRRRPDEATTSTPECSGTTTPSGLVVVDKPVGLDVARRRRSHAPAGRHPEGRPRRHARPDGHRRAGAGHQPGDASAGLPDAGPTRSTSRRSGSGSRPSPTTPRASVIERTDARRCTSTRRPCGRCCRPAPATSQQVPSSVSAIKVDGVRSYATVRAGEEVDAEGTSRDGLALRRSTTSVRPRATSSTSTCGGAAPAAPTSGPSRATSAPASASGDT